ncbi:HIG 1 N domain containing protein [Trichuris trichiura]|uniref:HIG 1 N domain containing protein n=1 Tax=Trichuris trichiura TaxID=36087 RepID=A0A077Z2H4_TRITR|nr:HIG 1 N domain containing protein [Trichuris trichiura]
MSDEHLQWVQKERSSGLPVEATPDPYLHARQRVYQMAKMNPLVPVGLLCMWGALGKGLSAFLRGDSALSNKMMRYRIYFHALTLVSIVGGSVAAAMAVNYTSPPDFSEADETKSSGAFSKS